MNTDQLIEYLKDVKFPKFGTVEILFKDNKPFDIIISERLRLSK